MTLQYPIDFDQVRTFLRFLDPDRVEKDEPFHFLWLGPKTDDPRIRRKEQNYMSFEGFARVAQLKHEEQLMPYVGINAMHNAKRANDNVKDFRAYFLDFDDTEPKISCEKLPPDTIVQSRRGQHWYWAARRQVPKDRPPFWPENAGCWRPAQMALADVFGSDRACTDPARVMRLPGSWHIMADKEPFQVQLLRCERPDFTGTRNSQLAAAYVGSLEPYNKLYTQLEKQNTAPWQGDLSVLPENLRQYFHCIRQYGFKIYKCSREPATWRTDCPLRKHKSGAHVVIKLNELGYIHQFCQAKEKHGCESDAIFNAFGLSYYARFPVR